jgi:hypothetical protein
MIASGAEAIAGVALYAIFAEQPPCGDGQSAQSSSSDGCQYPFIGGSPSDMLLS